MSGFDYTAATSSAYFAASSYCSRDSILSWNCEFCSPSLVNVTYLYNTSTETAGFVGFDVSSSAIILAFRGTVTTEEWLEDFDLTLVDPQNNTLCEGGDSVCVARGFFIDSYVSIRGQMHTALSRFPVSSPIIATGHSLGAIMAEYAAWELGAPRLRSVYTFGSPRGGNAAFAAAFAAAALPAVYRVTHAEDPVPHLPPMFFDYLHPPQEVFFPSQTNCAFPRTAPRPTAKPQTHAPYQRP